MPISCPHCGGAEHHSKLRCKKLLSFGHWIFGIATGVLGILIWYFSLESKFQYGNCGQTFFARTRGAKVFRVIFHAFAAAFVIAAGIAIYMLVFSK